MIGLWEEDESLVIDGSITIDGEVSNPTEVDDPIGVDDPTADDLVNELMVVTENDAVIVLSLGSSEEIPL